MKVKNYKFPDVPDEIASRVFGTAQRGNVMLHNKTTMKLTIITIILTVFYMTGNCQNFKYIKPNLTDSCKVVKTEIDTKNKFERLYYIDNSKNSDSKKILVKFDIDDNPNIESITQTYFGILKNEKHTLEKIKTNLPERWVKIFKYKGEWILFNNLPKYILSDSCLITFDMDDPTSSVITDYKFNDGKYLFDLLSYNWENPGTNLKSHFEIKVLDSKRMITLWKFGYQNQVSYDLMIPDNQTSHFPIMIMLETDLMDDENDIFDKIDYEKLWEK